MSQPQRKPAACQIPAESCPRALADFCGRGFIAPAQPLAEGQVQPASLDLRLGEWAYRARASFLTRSRHERRRAPGKKPFAP
jgi:hypothetical protein